MKLFNLSSTSTVKTVDATLRKHFECDSKITLWCLYIFHNVVPSRTDFCISCSDGMKNQPFKRIKICWCCCWRALLAKRQCCSYMQHSNNFEELGGIKKRSCLVLCVHICVKKKRKGVKHWGRQKWNKTARAEDLNNVSLCSINLYLFFTSYKVIDDADIGLLATHSTNLLLSQSWKMGLVLCAVF